tara:strand:- start:24 stop:164 length:141 start_codon:yes stop_codon:yes gene_type:complete
MPECAPFHNYLGEAHALLFILGHVAMERMGIFVIFKNQSKKIQNDY